MNKEHNYGCIIVRKEDTCALSPYTDQGSLSQTNFDFFGYTFSVTYFRDIFSYRCVCGMSQMLTSHLLSKVSSPWYLNWDHFPRSVISIIRLRSGITQGKILKLYTRTENFPAVRMLVVPNNIMETYIAGR